MRADHWNNLLYRYRWQATFLILGLILAAGGVILAHNSLWSAAQVEVVNSDETLGSSASAEIIIEVSGSVANPGVYHFPPGSRVEDALIRAGGLTSDADLIWIERTLNRAGKLVDGQKIYVPKQSDSETAKESGEEYSTSQSLSVSPTFPINVNVATQKELESLSGIGPVTAQNIIEQRPYSSVEELLLKKILRSDVYQKNKDLLSVY